MCIGSRPSIPILGLDSSTRKVKMGQECFKDSDTHWITFKCNFVNIRKSNNIEMDFTDSGAVDCGESIRVVVVVYHGFAESKKEKRKRWGCRRRKKQRGFGT